MLLHPTLPSLRCSHKKGPLHRGAGRSVALRLCASRQVAPGSRVGFPVVWSIFELQAQKVMARMVVTPTGPGNTLAVTKTSQLRFCRFGSRNRQLQPFRFAHGGHRGGRTDPVTGEEAAQVVDAMNPMSIEPHDDVAAL